MKKESKGLHCFAQAHVIGEDAVEFVLGQVTHPLVADCLVGPKGGLQSLRDFFRGLGGFG